MAGFPEPVIQVQPPGLLDLLGIQSGGKAPPLFGRYTQPVMDLGEWYLRGRQEEISSGAQAVAAGTGFNFASITVPNGQWWYFPQLGANVLTAVGNSIDGAVIAFETPTTAVFVSDSTGTMAASTTRIITENRPFWVPPGSRLGLYTGLTVLGTGTYVLRGTVTKVRV